MAASEGHLHLCTEQKTWAVKQVSTSNTVFVTKTFQAPIKDSDPDRDVDMDESEKPTPPEGFNDMDDIGKAHQGITTIAQVKSILELIPVEPSQESVEEQMLWMAYPLTDINGDNDQSMEARLSNHHNTTLYSFQEILDNIPAPTALCCRVAKTLTLVHLSTTRDSAQKICSYVTTPHLLAAWKEFMQQCVILGYKIDRPDPTGVTTSASGARTQGQAPSQRPTFGSVFQQLQKQHDDNSNDCISDFTSSLVRAILRRFKTRVTRVSNSDDTGPDMLDDEADWDGEPLDGGWQAETLTLILGRWQLERLLVQSRGPIDTNMKGVRSDNFLDTDWKNLVPDAWHRFCSLDTLLTHVNHDLTIVERYMAPVPDEFGIPEQKEFLRAAGAHPLEGLPEGAAAINAPAANGAAAAKAKVDPASAAANNQKKRKWHEKFGAQRQTALKK